MRNGCLLLSAVTVLYLGSQLSQAQLLKIDINNTSRTDNNAPGYTAWNLATDLSAVPGNQQATRIFTNAANSPISCTVSQTFPAYGTANTSLKADWGNKDGAVTGGNPDPSLGYRLSFDGLWTQDSSVGQPYTNGGAFCLVISNLSAGAHTITTYHNDVYGNRAGNSWHGSNNFMSGCVVSVDGAPILTNIPSYYATNDTQCGVAYFTVNAVADQPVVLSFDPDHTTTDNLDFVILNGFVIDSPTAPGTIATGAIPGDGDEHVFANNDDPTPGSAGTGSTTLRWTPSQFAVTNDVYFGTNSAAVTAATHASPEFKASQTTNVWDATNLDTSQTYYWRIDEVDATNGVFKSDTWHFRTRHLAFPGAEGYGRFAIGGRGGVVMIVTNLNDSGPGSLREAVEASGPRTVVFNVSGLITLESKLQLHNPYITVAGQTAPGKGICLRKYNFGMLGAKDAIIRNVRVRPGNIAAITLDGMGMASSDHSIVDHCSVGWSIDEAFSSRSAGNITLQRTLISEALNEAGHTNYPPGTKHGYAASIGGMIGSFHHNLLAHCEGRNWSLAGGVDSGNHFTGRLDIRNNVVYNWGHRATDGGAMEVNFVNNLYKPGAATDYFFALNAQYEDNFAGMQRYYFDGNVMPGHFSETNQTAGRVATGGYIPTNYVYWVGAPFFDSFVDTQTAGEAYKRVLSDVGCNQPLLDDHDVRVIQETRDGTYTYVGSLTGKPGLPDTQDDVGGWETYTELTRAADWDSDHDGLPDWWETIHGTNINSPPNDFSDSNADPDGDGYSNLEDYLNWLAAPHVSCVQDSYVDVDLSQLTIGFTNQPVHTVFGATNGAVTITNTTARFTPTSGFTGLGGFRFAVVDADNSTMTNTVGVQVTPAPPPPLTPFEQWQVDYFGSTTNAAAGPDFDADGDGMSNTNEFLSGTNPTSSLSVFRIISVVRQGTNVVITWATAGGRTNVVQTSSGSGNGSYTTNFTDLAGSLTIIPGIGDSTTNYVDSAGATNMPARYYRIRLVP